MNCTDARGLLYRFVDGALLDEERREIGEHLDSCSACAARLACIADLDELLATVEDDTPGPQLRTRILADFRRWANQRGPARRAPVRRAAWLRRVAALLAIVVTTASTTWWVTGRDRRPEASTPQRPVVDVAGLFPLRFSETSSTTREDGTVETRVRLTSIE